MKKDISTNKDLVAFVPRWKDMVIAIDKCHSTDEAKSIRDKAMALEVYARQALNFEAEQKAKEIRIRAERRSGELLKNLERGKTGPKELSLTVNNNSPYAKAKEQANISEDQARRWQKLALVPKAEFEQKLKEGTTTSALIEDGPRFRQLPPIPLWLYGVLMQFEERDVFRMDINDVFAQCNQSGVQDRVEKLIIAARDWFAKFEGGQVWKKQNRKNSTEADSSEKSSAA